MNAPIRIPTYSVVNGHKIAVHSGLSKKGAEIIAQKLTRESGTEHRIKRERRTKK